MQLLDAPLKFEQIFFLQFLVDILLLDPHIWPDPDPGTKMLRILSTCIWYHP